MISAREPTIVATDQPKPLDKERNNNFNLLRLLFAVMVIVGHAPAVVDGDEHRDLLRRTFGNSQSFGELGVAGFFLLSGYLIVKSWDRDPSLRDFLAKRVLRIYPAFVVATIVSGLLVPVLVVSNWLAFLRSVSLTQFLGAMILLRTPGVPQFFPPPFPLTNASLWTISHEFRCYLMVAALGVLGLVRRRMLWLAISVVFGITSLLITDAANNVPRIVTLVMGDPTQIARLGSLFTAGGCFYLFRSMLPLRDGFAAVAAVVLIGLLFSERLHQLGLLTAGAYVLFWFAFRQMRVLRSLKGLPDVSYGLYLYAWPIQKLLVMKFPGMSPWTQAIYATAGAAAAGYVSWHTVERWFLRLKPRPTVSAEPEMVLKAAYGEPPRDQPLLPIDFK